MATNHKGLARFTKGNRQSCEIFTQGLKEFWGPQFIKEELMRYARNISSFKSFSETRDRF